MMTQYAIMKRPAETKSGTEVQLVVKTDLRKECHPALIKIPHHTINKHPEERHREQENQQPIEVIP